MAYQQYIEALQKIADIKYASAVLQWDQETYMPQAGAHFRGKQIATLAELAHEKFTSAATEQIIVNALADETLTITERKNVVLTFEDLQKSKKLSTAFVGKMSEAINQSFHAWIAARNENNFKVFEAPLQTIVALKQEEAALLGYADHPYDALMNDYDKGLTVKATDQIFADLTPKLTHIIDKVKQQPQADNSFLHQHFPKQKQWDFGLKLLTNMHYNFNAGRQDVSEHPFTTNFSSQDVRVTTRVDENDFSNMLWSCIHEGGHALYEQGLPNAEYGLPLGEYCSLSIHESQSRLWENCIGRSLPFWKNNFPALKKVFPTQFKGVKPKRFFAAINKVTPSLIRTEADELTYHFHVIIRYEIEKMLISGSLKVSDIPQVWNSLYKKYLGVNVPDHKQGCLQDVHWSHGSFGYFATYSVGSLYAAQFWETIQLQYPTVNKQIAKGDYGQISEWLNKNIYRFGRMFTSDELCKNATGSKLNSAAFINYANNKFLG